MAEHLLLAGGRVFTGDAVIDRGFVEIDGKKIAAVGRMADRGSTVFDGTVIDVAGMTVLPGLIDTHVHLLHQPVVDRGLSEGATAIWAAEHLKGLFAHGITAVRDLGTKSPAIFGVKQALASGIVAGPRLLAAGAALCMTGGHGWHELSLEADGIEGLRHAARLQLRQGADVIKLMATGGAGTPGSPGASQLSIEEMAAAVTEAHHAGKPAAAHALGAEGIANALAAGVDSIEHGVFLDEAAIELMLRRGAVLCPTLGIYHRIVERGAATGAPPFMVDKARAITGPHMASVRRAVAAGVPIVFGTDAGAGYYEIGDFADELRLMGEAEMSATAILRAATAAAASACRIDHLTGSLKPGLAADILVVRGDATADAAALAAVELVFRDGAPVFAATAA